MTADPVEMEIAGVKVQILRLPFDTAQPMLPVIAELIAIASRDLIGLVQVGKIDPKADTVDPKVIMALMPAMQGVAQFLDGKLEKLAAKIFSRVRVVINDEWQDLSKQKDRDLVFDEKPELYLPLLFEAGKLNFARYFPVGGRRAGTTQPPSR